MGEHTIKIWDLNNLSQPSSTFDAFGVRSMKVFETNENKFIAVGGNAGNIKIYNLKNNTLELTLGEYYRFEAVVVLKSFTKDGNIFLLSRHRDGVIILWDIKSKSYIHTFGRHCRWIKSLNVY